MIAFVVSLIGVALCLYGLHIQHRLRVNPNYKAACDLSDRVSCTQTFRSQYGALLGISNIYMGLLFYAGMAVCAFFSLTTLFKLGACGALVVSIYLAYLQYIKLRIVCLLCSSLYLVNGILFVLAMR